MSRYTDDSREKVRDAVDFIELVNARTELKRAGVRRYQGLCPFHDERSPSFGIDPIEKLYHCFGCGQGGDVFKFVMETENLDFPAALESLAERYGVTLELETEDPQITQKRSREQRLLELLDRTASFYERVLWESDDAAPAREYLAERGLKDGVQTYRVGFAPDAWDRVATGSRKNGFTEAELLAAGLVIRGNRGGVYDRFRGRVVFPLWDPRGKIRGFGARAMKPDEKAKYINSADGEMFRKGRWLYATHLAREQAAKTGEVILVEGYTDALALHQAGFANVVGCMGTALTPDQAGELSRLARVVLLCLDADSAGREAMLRIAKLVEGRQRDLRVVALPAGSDPADFVAEHGGEAFRALLSSAVPFPRFELEQVLRAADLSSPVGRDHALSSAAPIVGALDTGALREDLVAVLSTGLALSPEVVQAVLSKVGGRNMGNESRGAGAGVLSARSGPDEGRNARRSSNSPGTNVKRETLGASDPFAPLHRRGEIEQAFLAMCIALPQEGERQLEELEIDSVFSSSLFARVAHYLRGRLGSPGAELPGAEPAIAAAVTELVVRAGELTVTATTLELEAMQLQLGRLDREIAAARSGGEKVSELAAQRQHVLDSIRQRLH